MTAPFKTVIDPTLSALSKKYGADKLVADKTVRVIPGDVSRLLVVLSSRPVIVPDVAEPELLGVPLELIKDQLKVSALAAAPPKTAEAPSNNKAAGFRRVDEIRTATRASIPKNFTRSAT